ncbi:MULTISPECIES: ABC transporter permease [Ralstonia]|uniref:2-aminoethylphosphonate transport system permease protein PhnU n=1 Tax=Ralstonia holmesii TaxID=3058602 RepID=A0ABC8Q9T2_9RALS|nr:MULTISPECIES: ABC transporter permease [unclassified Ralstonia]CAJ0703043.1 Putative 2-aminoethylphosphonate transport system permease protein PhnU [Ralstonia sp. LMG 32967]CAJ0784448.1 Putative 2-aminoethylphosphonate transport system permease protein PhnU [Ralstonia sp. LMG 32967]CAJ0815248.1 Putative 2-aminoethylphosphonate transport system permease protein PhnU [Ralstonia sp. LMG 32967]
MSTVTRTTLPDDAVLPARWRVALLAPAVALFCAFWLLPMAALLRVSGSEGLVATYTAAVTTPRYLGSLFSTVVLSAAVTLATLVLSTIAGLFLVRHNVPGKRMITAMLTFPLAFPGVVVGFMVILLAGRQGLLGDLTHKLVGEKWVFAYSIGGLFLGYLYFSIPRVVLTVMAAAEKLDRSLEEAARSLGASSWQVTRDVLVPGLAPALIASGAICFATSMGAFGTAFTLATDIDVLPMTIYTEFTLNAGIAMAAALSVVLGVVTWLVLAIARTAAGGQAGAAA